MPHLHICASGEANREANDERTTHIFAWLFVASLASPFMALALEAVFRTRVKKDEWQFTICVRTCECSYARENSSFSQRQRHTNVRASGETRHKHVCVNAVLENHDAEMTGPNAGLHNQLRGKYWKDVIDND